MDNRRIDRSELEKTTHNVVGDLALDNQLTKLELSDLADGKLFLFEVMSKNQTDSAPELDLKMIIVFAKKIDEQWVFKKK